MPRFSLQSLMLPRSVNVKPTVARGNQSRIQHLSHALTLKYRRQNRAISSILGIDSFVKFMELPT